MTMITRMTGIARSSGDPEVLSTGPSARSPSDRLARALGWISIGLGLVELLAAPRVTRALGLEGKERMVRACGAREIAAGVMSLSVSPRPGIAARIAGDALDLASLAAARRRDNPKKNNVDLALAAVLGVTLLDIVCHQGLRARHQRPRVGGRDYSDRSGLPKGIEASRGLARRDAPTADDGAPAMAI